MAGTSLAQGLQWVTVDTPLAEWPIAELNSGTSLRGLGVKGGLVEKDTKEDLFR